MELVIACVLFSIIFYTYLLLSARVLRCEKAIKQMQGQRQSAKVSTEPPNTSADPRPALPPAPPAPRTVVKEIPAKTVATEAPLPIRSLRIPRIVKENWMGVFGSIALVIGAAFFGLTSEIMQLPEARVGLMLLLSFLALGVSSKLQKYETWASLSVCLKSIAGTVILFASLASGNIEGLQFIQTPLYALLFLCFGILVNIAIALRASQQKIASLHVILSITAFCVTPQTLLLLPIGALVACTGLLAAYRSKWNLHLVLITLAYTLLNMVWSTALDAGLDPNISSISIASSVAVSLCAAFGHYSKIYRRSALDAFPFIAHLSNWGLLIWNISLHAEFSSWTPPILGGVAVAGFILAQIARKKEIFWLYRTDTLVSQLVAVASIASLTRVSIAPIDICILTLVEVLVFNFLCRLWKEELLFRLGSCLQYLTCMVSAGCVLQLLPLSSDADLVPLLIRMGLITALSWGFHLMGSLTDDLRFVLFGEKPHTNPVSTTGIFGTLFFLGAYVIGFDTLAVQAAVLIVIGLIALWRKFKEDATWNITLVLSLVCVHVACSVFLIFAPDQPASSRVDLLGLILLDLILIFGNFLHLQAEKRNIHHFVTYALGLLAGLVIISCTEPLSPLIPGLAFLGLSLLGLEVGGTVPYLFRYSDDVKTSIRQGMNDSALAFLLAFLVRFVTIHLQVDPIWHGMSLRWMTEGVSVLSIAYWIAFSPPVDSSSRFTQAVTSRMIEILLGFVTLCAFVELAEAWRPCAWVLLAMALLCGSLYAAWPKRLLVYSWIYLVASIVHVAFVTSTLTMPSLFIMEQHCILALAAVALQLCYACLAHTAKGRLLKSDRLSSSLYGQASLTVTLPVFLGIALLFAFNFENAILTLLWVGLTCVYFAVGLFSRSKLSIQVAMAALLCCCGRLMIFDLVQRELATRALVFIGVGCLMLGMSTLYKRYRYRTEACEQS